MRGLFECCACYSVAVEIVVKVGRTLAGDETGFHVATHLSHGCIARTGQPWRAVSTGSRPWLRAKSAFADSRPNTTHGS
jgi:hypothetical protein